MSGEPTHELPPAWKVKAREKTGLKGEEDLVTYERDSDGLRVIVTEYPDGEKLCRWVSASVSKGKVSIAQEAAVRKLFLWPGVEVKRFEGVVNKGVEWFIQEKRVD